MVADAEEIAVPPRRTAVIIGAGPAGLTAAWELLQRTDYHPVVLEMSDQLGGLSQTVVHNGNRIDIGGHRFFTKVDRVMDWWLDMLPLQQLDQATPITYHRRTTTLPASAGPDTEAMMLVRPRKSRIYFQRQFFDYPLRLTPDTLRKLGVGRTARIAASYARASLRQRPEHSLEDFLINRFGRQLYRTFFKSYTEKVWGVPCHEISADWGAQRIKGLNLRTALEHFLRRLLPGSPVDIAQKDTETSLIEQFLYPRLGPGQMWETVAARVQAAGGEVRTGWEVVEVRAAPDQQRVTGVVARGPGGARRVLDADVVISTMPIQELVRALAPTAPAPPAVRAVSEGLIYRDFFTVGVLADRLKLHDTIDGAPVPIRDNWLYIQDPDVHVGRMQIFNNWSPALVRDPSTAWVGMEYFCTRGDALWSRSDDALMALAREECARLGILDPRLVRDQCVIRMPRTYPAYFGTYGQFDTLRAWLDPFHNLMLVGRNGMHRYNNQDHSMLTAMMAVDQLAAGTVNKADLWAVNTEQEYHEVRRDEGEPR